MAPSYKTAKPTKTVKRSKTAKRSAPNSGRNDSSDDMPFKIILMPRPGGSRKRKRDKSGSETEAGANIAAPGSFEFEKNDFDAELGIHWTVEPSAKWKSMRRYQKFIGERQHLLFLLDTFLLSFRLMRGLPL